MYSLLSINSNDSIPQFAEVLCFLTVVRCFYVVDNIYQRVRGNSTQLQRMLN